MNQTPKGKLHTPILLWYKSSKQPATSGHFNMLRTTTTWALVFLFLFTLTKFSIGHVCVTGPSENSQPTDPSTSVTTSTTTTQSPSTSSPTTTRTRELEANPGSAVDGSNACKC